MKILLSEEDVRQGVERLAQEVTGQYSGQELTIVGLMTGSIVLMADLIRLLEMPLRVGVMQTSSYRNSTSSGSVEINDSMIPEVRGKHVLVVDDIFDTGKTMDRVFKVLMQHHPKSIRSVVLLFKSGKQQVDYRPDFVAFDIPDEFVVGYGLDYCDAYRNLPFIAALEPEDINQTL